MSGDIYKIEEVVTNYISNAINHCTRGGTITVSYSMYSDRVRVSVFNTGEPIPDKDIENIWNKFYKVDKARTRNMRKRHRTVYSKGNYGTASQRVWCHKSQGWCRILV